MKKLFKLLTVLALSFTTAACGNNSSTELDLTQVQTAVESVKSTTFDRINAVSYLSMSEYFGYPIEYYDWDFEGLDITLENIAFDESTQLYDYSFGEDKDAGYAYFIGKAANDNLKTELDAYFSNLGEHKSETFEDYLVYIASSDNEAAYKLFSDNAYPAVMNGLIYLSSEEVEMSFGLTEELVDEYVIGFPTFITSASQYIIVKPAEDKEEDVKTAMETYMTNLQAQWDMYLPDQAELVNNRLETNIGDYLVYIVSSNNDAILEAIESCTK